MKREEMIEMLVNEGANRWTNYGKDRLYLGKAGKLFGFEIEERYGSSGRISAAKLDGEYVSNNYAAEIEDDLKGLYIDLNTMKLRRNNAGRRTVIVDRVKDMLNAIEA